MKRPIHLTTKTRIKLDKLTYEDDGRREFYTLNGDYLRVASNGELQRFVLGEWRLVKASDYPNALLAKLSELLNDLLSEDYDGGDPD